MPNQLRFSINNHADVGVITGLTSVASLPMSNLKDEDIQRIWRSAETGAQQSIIADIGALQTIGVVALINVANTGSTFNVRVSSADPTGLDGNPYEALNIPTMVTAVYNTFVHFIEPAVSGRYVRITLNNLTASPEGGRIVIADTWLPSRNVSLVRPPEELPMDHTIISYSLGGNRFQDVRSRQRRYRFTLRNIPTAEKITYIDEINRVRGIGREVLVCFDKSSSTLAHDTIWGNLTTMIQLRRMGDMVSHWECDFELEERI